MDRLRPVEWCQEQLGHRHASSTRRWLRRNGVRLIRGKVLESEFFAVWKWERIVDQSIRENWRS